MSDTPLSQRHKPFIHRRTRAVLATLELGVEECARQAGCTSRHLWFVLTNQRRPSAELLVKIRALLGEPGYAFATGQSDSLLDHRLASEVAAHAA